MKIRKHHLIISSIVGFLILCFVYYLIFLSPAFSRRAYLEERVAKMRDELNRMRNLKTEWEAFQQNRDEAEKTLKKRGKDFTLLTYLEGVCRQSGIESKIQYMKPLSFSQDEGKYKPDGIEIGLQEIGTRDLVNLLYKIEYSKNLLSIKRIKINPVSRGNKRTLDVTLQVHTYVPL